MTQIRIFGVTLLVMFVAACGPKSSPPAFEVDSVGAPLSPSIEEVHQEMALIAQNHFCNVDTDCATMPIGYRACGGPSAYMVYSKLIGDESIVALEDLAKQSVELAQQKNQRNEMMSTCEIIPPAVAACIEQRCVITSPRNLLESGTPDPDSK